MMRTLVKALLAFAGTIAGGIALVVLGAAFLLPDMCGADVLRVVPSPDGRLEAVVTRGSCGATTGFSGNVSVVRRGTTPPTDNTGNAFRIGDPGRPTTGAAVSPTENLTLRWLGSDRLLIEYDIRGRVLLRESQVGRVRIEAVPTTQYQ